MWIFLNDAFLSIVQPPRGKKHLLVRARVRGDIERVFPGAKVEETPQRDYRFRALISRAEVAEALAAAVEAIAYGNFKASVKEGDRHRAYAGVWSEMLRFQLQRLQPGRRRPGLDDEYPWIR